MSSTFKSSSKRRSMIPVKELKKLVDDPASGIHLVRATLRVGLHPRYLGNLALGLIVHFNKQIGIHQYELNGVLAGYGKLYLRQPTGGLTNEQAVIRVEVTSDFWVFRPEVGSTLSGVVSKKSASHVSCLLHGCFNVPCFRPQDRAVNEWCGSRVQLDQTVTFTVVKVDMSQRIPSVMGTLLDENSDNQPRLNKVLKVEEECNEDDGDDGDSGIDSAAKKSIKEEPILEESSKKKRKREGKEETKKKKRRKTEENVKIEQHS